MTVNRYTSLTPSTYKPMSMQEIMMTPLAMRHQHNQAQQQIQSGLDELDKINSIDKHTPELIERKNMLIGKIDALSSDLANKGFSNDMTSNVLKLNRNIKEELGPQGRLGQIQGAYNAYQKHFEDFKKSNEDKTWDDTDMKRNWAKHSETYQGYDEKGNITNIGSLSAPEKWEVTDSFKELKSIMGDAHLAYKTLTGGTTWFDGPNGSIMSRDTETGKETKYNNPQVVGVLRKVVGELNDPTSKLSKSREYSGRSIEQALQESGDLARSMVDVELGQTNKSKENIHAAKNSLDAAAAEGSLSLLDTTQTSEDYEGTVGEATSIINKYTANPPKTNDERLEYYQALRQKTQFDENIKDVNIGDKLTKSDGTTLSKHYAKELGLGAGVRVNYNYVKKIVKEKEEKFLKNSKNHYEELYKKNLLLPEGSRKTTGELREQFNKSGKNKGEKIVFDDIERTVFNNYKNNVSKYKKVEHNYKNDIFKSSNTYSGSYTPHFEGKEDSAARATFKDLDVKLTNSLSDMISSPQGGAFVSDISTEDGKNLRLTNKNIVGKREAVNKYILNNMKNVELVSFSDTGGKGVLPSVRLKINLKDDAETGVNIDGMFSEEMGGKTMHINMVVPDVTSIKQGNMGTNSIYQQIFNAVGKYGDTPAKKIVTSARQRQTKYGR